MAFAFHPQLFEHRTEALEALAAAGYAWLSDFSSVDLLHEVYGLEVCGIPDRDDARAIRRVLRRTFRRWPFCNLSLKDWGDRDLGWRVVIHRDVEAEGGAEEWSQA